MGPLFYLSRITITITSKKVLNIYWSFTNSRNRKHKGYGTEHDDGPDDDGGPVSDGGPEGDDRPVGDVEPVGDGGPRLWAGVMADQ